MLGCLYPSIIVGEVRGMINCQKSIVIHPIIFTESLQPNLPEIIVHPIILTIIVETIDKLSQTALLTDRDRG